MAKVASPYGFASTAAEVVAGVDLHGQRAVVTGAAGGIGIETARALADAGAEVTLAVRRQEAGEAAAAHVKASTDNSAIHVQLLDVSDLASVAAFAERWSGPLHILCWRRRKSAHKRRCLCHGFAMNMLMAHTATDLGDRLLLVGRPL